MGSNHAKPLFEKVAVNCLTVRATVWFGKAVACMDQRAFASVFAHASHQFLCLETRKRQVWHGLLSFGNQHARLVASGPCAWMDADK